jgi:proteasome accessory factor PafA2
VSVRRIMGIETEYGVLEPGNPRSNAVALSTYVVAAYAQVSHHSPRIRWDYQDEDPLCDARGFRLDRASAHPSMLTDVVPAEIGAVGQTAPLPGQPAVLRRPRGTERPDVGPANVILSNGARLYVDHAHPEYSTPEVTSPLDAVRWDRAGEEIMLTAARALAASPHLPDAALYKNNVDGKGASYGTHENYLMNRSVPFGEVVRYLTPFLVTRPIVCGAGRVGIGPAGEQGGFQISQRADYIEAEVGLETTLRRPIINTRDEPHADPARYRRLHLITGDANLLEVSTYLKLGTTALLLWLLERGSVPLELDGLELVDPVGELHAVSRDLDLSHRLTLADGRSLRALDVQRLYHDVLARAVEAAGEADEQTADVLSRWASVLDRLAADPMTCAADVEWVAKLRVLEGMRARDHLSWDNARLAALDLQWSDVRPERGVFARVAGAGAVERLVGAEEVAAAMQNPPHDTRAYFRGESVRRFGADLAAANWDSVVFDIPGEKSLQRIPMLEPHRGTRAHVGALFDRSPSASALIAALVSGG